MITKTEMLELLFEMEEKIDFLIVNGENKDSDSEYDNGYITGLMDAKKLLKEKFMEISDARDKEAEDF